MPQDAFTLRALCSELNNVFKGGKVNRIIEPINERVIFSVYKNKEVKKLLIDVSPQNPRIGVSLIEEDSPLSAPNFCMLLRKYLINAEILEISLLGFDRICKIDFSVCHEFCDNEIISLYVELMGRYSNIILTENNKILGGNRGINFFDNGVRPLIVNSDYVFPPNQNKKTPLDTSLVDDLINYNGENLEEFLTKTVSGISDETARELVFCYLDKENLKKEDLKENIIKAPKKFYEFLCDFLINPKINPVVIIDNSVKDFLCFDYKTVKGDRKFFNFLIDAESYYYKEKETEKFFAKIQNNLKFVVNGEIKKLNKKLKLVNDRLSDAESLEENKLKGELIISNIYRIKQGDKSVVLDNYYNGEKVEVVLDEFLPPQKNAEKYYKKYNKQKRSIEYLMPQKTEMTEKLDYFNSVLDELDYAENINDLNCIKEELISLGLVKEQFKSKKKIKELNYREYDILGFILKVGRNNIENDKLTFSANEKSIFLHAKDYHSAHAIIEYNNKTVPDKVILIASEITAYYSKGKFDKIEVIYTERKNVKKPKKANVGLVTYENYKSVFVKGNKHEEYLKSF